MCSRLISWCTTLGINIASASNFLFCLLLRSIIKIHLTIALRNLNSFFVSFWWFLTTWRLYKVICLCLRIFWRQFRALYQHLWISYEFRQPHFFLFITLCSNLSVRLYLIIYIGCWSSWYCVHPLHILTKGCMIIILF